MELVARARKTSQPHAFEAVVDLQVGEPPSRVIFKRRSLDGATHRPTVMQSGAPTHDTPQQLTSSVPGAQSVHLRPGLFPFVAPR